MTSYIIKRILLFIPTLFLVSVVAFLLSKAVSSDPVFNLLNAQGLEESSQNYKQEYNALYKEMNLDKNWFYMTIRPSYYSDNIYKLTDRHERNLAQTLQDKRFTSDYISTILNKIRILDEETQRTLYYSSDIEHLSTKINQSQTMAPSSRRELLQLMAPEYQEKTMWHYPTLKWNGTDNQYHTWMSNILAGDFGTSYLDARPVSDKLWDALKWTIVLVSLNIFFAILFAFPLGIYNGMNTGSTFDKWSNAILFGLYAIPKFWLATLLIVFFTTAEYGGWTNIFPNPGRWYTDASQSFLSMISQSLYKLILPVLILVIPDVAYLGRMIRTSIIEEKSKEYIKTAMVKGLSKYAITKKHILPNALVPTITLLAGSLPTAIASSLVIEVIFNIPGIGRLMFDSIAQADWATVYPILFIISILTVVSYLLADVLMSWLNPKIKLG